MLKKKKMEEGVICDLQRGVYLRCSHFSHVAMVPPAGLYCTACCTIIPPLTCHLETYQWMTNDCIYCPTFRVDE